MAGWQSASHAIADISTFTNFLMLLLEGGAGQDLIIGAKENLPLIVICEVRAVPASVTTEM